MGKRLLGLIFVSLLAACAGDSATGALGYSAGDVVDSNGDGVPDGIIVANPDGTLGVDLNGDGIADGPARGTIISNGRAVDSNGDGILDAIDGNGDGVGDIFLGTPGGQDGGVPTDAGGFVGDPDSGVIHIVDDAGCGAIEKTADIKRGPVDIVWAIDSSGSMADEFLNVMNNINNFAQSITATGLDVHVVMIHLFGVAGDPLANTPLGKDPSKYKYILANVDSWNSLQILLDQYDSGYKSFLRPNASTHFVVVSDDQSRPMTAADFKPQMTSKLGHDFYFHAVVADGQNGCNGSSVGSEYLSLADMTMGKKLSICATDWAPLFTELEKAVVESAPLPCDFEIPPPPDGKTFDSTKVQVNFKPAGGQTSQFPLAGTEDKCGDATGWFYDDPAAPTRIEFCPAACTTVKAGGSVGIAFGCEPVEIF